MSCHIFVIFLREITMKKSIYEKSIIYITHDDWNAKQNTFLILIYFGLF